LDQKDYAGARLSAEEVLKQNPEDTRALNVLVAAYAAQKQLPAGLERARAYAARQPGSAALQQFLGQILADNGDRAGAQKAFEAAKAADPALIAPDLSLADLEISEGKREDARKRLSVLVSSHPGSVAGRLMWAQLEATDGRSSAAIEQYRKVLKLDSRNMVALNNLAYLLADGNQPDEALKYAQMAKEIAPDSPAVDDTLGWVYFRKGMYSLAVTHLESAIARDGTARRKYHLAMAYIRAGDPKRGRQVLEAALKMDSRLPEADEARRILANGVR
jgi:predicted Zn-dependent protease